MHGIVGLGQRQQAGALDLEGLAYTQTLVLAPTQIGRLALAPRARLGVEIVHVGDVSRGEEGIPDEADLALHAALLVASGYRHRARLVTVVGCEGQQLGVEGDGVAYPLQHGTLEIVVERVPSQPSPPHCRQAKYRPGA